MPLPYSFRVMRMRTGGCSVYGHLRQCSCLPLQCITLSFESGEVQTKRKDSNPAVKKQERGCKLYT